MLHDFIGAFASLLSTYYFIRLDNKAWPIGILATIINGWLYWRQGIYADMCLECFYLASLSYGWFRWHTHVLKKETHIVSRLSNQQWMYLGVSIGILYTTIYLLLTACTHSTVAKLDALTTALSLVAQGLMCHKMILTWLLWFLADANYVVMYWQKNLPFHTGLMLIYTSMAVVGYWHWSRKARSEKQANGQIKQCPNLG